MKWPCREFTVVLCYEIHSYKHESEINVVYIFKRYKVPKLVQQLIGKPLKRIIGHNLKNAYWTK